jgi:hypothetical protein
MTLMVLSIAGYGNPMSWREDETPPEGHQLTFRQTLRLMSKNRVLRQLVPVSMRRFFKAGEEVDLADQEIKVLASRLHDGEV